MVAMVRIGAMARCGDEGSAGGSGGSGGGE